MKITIIGTGFVGLPMAGAMAEVGNHVMCMDTDTKKIEMLKNGKMPIYEPGLEPLIKKNTKAGRISYTSDPKVAVTHGDILFIAVGTPPDEDGSADLQYVLAVAKSIGENMMGYKVVVDKSTVPVGTADKVKDTIQKELHKRKKKILFDVVSNPEFMAEGRAVADFKNPDRIVIGTDSAKARKMLQELYAPFNRSHERVIEMDVRSAELTKYAANALLATKISFMNDLARLSEKLGADIESVRRGIGSDPRIGYHWIYPGPGYGGACFPKDVKAIVKTAKDCGHDLRILRMVEAVNADQKKFLFEKISAHFKKDLKGKVIAVWGLAFKANTDDMREASSRVLMEALWKAGATVRAYDPQAEEEAKRIYGDKKGLILCKSPEEAIEGADALAILTEWEIFRSPDFKDMKKRLKSPFIFDGRNLYDPSEMKKRGFLYFAIGRGEKLENI
ncbi:MAG: UDP-glucose/GDP-mannose dehydrogenase family protein [Candidatus Moraniibacteriota bacterium]|nr:MAG: UDP-glucose/GDP-mannose dehydrogenase family protein [Candidatus Moranbacteria bacterium]